MINGKIGGLVISGVAGYLLISKTINFLQSSVKNVCEASKWKAYYKHCKDPLVVPPGYACSSRPINDSEEVVVEDPSKKVDPEKAEKNKENATKIVESVTEAVKTIAKDVMENRKKHEEDPLNDLTDSIKEDREDGVQEVKVDDLFTKEGDLNNDQTVD